MFFALKSNADDSYVANFLKVKPFAVTACRRDGKHLKDKIAEIYGAALDLEYQIKSGRLAAGHAVFLLQGMFA
jgi:hypothetical protein